MNKMRPAGGRRAAFRRPVGDGTTRRRSGDQWTDFQPPSLALGGAPGRSPIHSDALAIKMIGITLKLSSKMPRFIPRHPTLEWALYLVSSRPPFLPDHRPI